MRISELSAGTGVPVATVKYYLREGLLPAGRATGATRAEYDEEHRARLRLVRALVEVAGLPLASVRRVLACLDDRPAADSDQATAPASHELHEALGLAHDALPPAVRDDVDTAPARAVLDQLGWRYDPSCRAVAQLAQAMEALVVVGLDASPALVAEYGVALQPVVDREVTAVPTWSSEAALEFAVVGTVLYEPVLLALRRLGHQDASARRFGGPSKDGGAPGGAGQHEGPVHLGAPGLT